MSSYSACISFPLVLMGEANAKDGDEKAHCNLVQMGLPGRGSCMEYQERKDLIYLALMPQGPL